MTDDIALTDTQIKLLDLMFYYRCATPIQLAAFTYGPLAVTISNEKYVYGQLAKMEEAGLVVRYKPNKRISKYAVFYLSKKGFDYKQTQLSLPEKYVGSGWITHNQDVDYGYFDYSVYKPPTKQLQHHLLMIDTLLVLNPFTDITYRNNLYAKRDAVRTVGGQQMLRPDAEFKINNQVMTIEIDRGTESHEQLVTKFENYFRYEADYRNKYGHFDIQHILFIVDAPHDGHLNRRWTNILAAYYKAMRNLADNFELHLVTLDNLDKFLLAYLDNDSYKPPLERAILSRFNLRLAGKKETNAYHHKDLGIYAPDESKTYNLHYQLIATPYSTVNLKLRLAAFEIANPMHYYVVSEPYFADLSSYLTNTDKDYIRDVLAQYERAHAPCERLYELK